MTITRFPRTTLALRWFSTQTWSKTPRTMHILFLEVIKTEFLFILRGNTFEILQVLKCICTTFVRYVRRKNYIVPCNVSNRLSRARKQLTTLFTLSAPDRIRESTRNHIHAQWYWSWFSSRYTITIPMEGGSYLSK